MIWTTTRCALDVPLNIFLCRSGGDWNESSLFACREQAYPSSICTVSRSVGLVLPCFVVVTRTADDAFAFVEVVVGSTDQERGEVVWCSGPTLLLQCRARAPCACWNRYRPMETTTVLFLFCLCECEVVCLWPAFRNRVFAG